MRQHTLEWMRKQKKKRRKENYEDGKKRLSADTYSFHKYLKCCESKRAVGGAFSNPTFNR